MPRALTEHDAHADTTRSGRRDHGRDQPRPGRRQSGRAHRAHDGQGKPFYQLHYPFRSKRLPRRGQGAICLALTMRMQQLVGILVPDDERDGPTEEGVDEKTIDRLATSIEVLEPAEMVH